MNFRGGTNIRCRPTTLNSTRLPSSRRNLTQAPPRQRGCFFYGCIIASVLALLMVILVAIVVFVGYRFAQPVRRRVHRHRAARASQGRDAGRAASGAQGRVEAFRKAVEAGTPTEPLVLTSDDLNALIEENPDLKGKIYVKVEGDEVKGQVSIPLDKLGLAMFRAAT